MSVLIVVSRPAIGEIWAKALGRLGMNVFTAGSEHDAIALLHSEKVSVIIMELELSDGASLAISDFASYKQPDAKVIFVNNGQFFSDGSIFHHCANAAAMVPAATSANDMAVLAAHHGARIA